MPPIAELEAVITADTSDFDSKMSASGQAVDDLGNKTTTASANFGAASATMAAGAAAIGLGIADAVSMAGDFQSTMNEVGAVTGATADQMSQLSATALQVGQDTSFSAQEGAEAIAELGKAGIAIPDILNGAAMATANLAAAGGVDMPRAAEVMSNAMNTFKISGDQAADVADILAGAANASAADINQLAMGMAQAGPAAAGLGLSLNETVAQLALFSDRGMQGSDAGTSLKTMLASLTPSTKQANEAFMALGLSTAETGNRFFDAQGQFVGMEQASNILYDALKGLTDEQRAAALETIFGSDASRAAELTFQAQKAAVEGTGKGYADYLAAVEPAGQATDVANAKMAGMNGALEALSGSIDTAKIAFGMAFLPVVEQVAEGVTNLVNVFIGLPEPVQNVISAVTAGTAAFLAIGSAVGFIIGPLGAVVTAAAPVVTAIAAISTPLIAVVAAIAALKIAYDTNFLGFADGVNAAIPIVLGNLQNLIDLFQNVVTAFQDGGLPAAVGVIASAFQTAWTNIQTAITSIDWGAVSATIQGALQAISDAALTWAGEMGTNILTAFQEIDWSAVGETLLQGATDAIGMMIGLDLLMVQKANEILQGLVDGLVDKWPDVEAWFTALGPLIDGFLADAATWLVTRGTELIGGLFDGINDKWPDVDEWLGNLGADATETVGDLGTTLLDAGTALIQGLADGAQDLWDGTLEPWLADAGPNAVDAVGDLSATLFDAGTALLQGLYDAALALWDGTLSPWLTNLGPASVTAVGELGSLLTAAGNKLIDGLRSGAQNVWNNTLGPWLQNIGSMIVSAVGDLSTDLYNAGNELINGFLHGMQDAWNGLLGWVGNLSIPWPQFSGPSLPDIPIPGQSLGTQSASSLSQSAMTAARLAAAATPVTPPPTTFGSGFGTTIQVFIDRIDVVDGRDFIEIISGYAQMTNIAAGRGAS